MRLRSHNARASQIGGARRATVRRVPEHDASEGVVDDQWAGEQARAVHLIATVLMTLTFLYASAIPLKFSTPDFGSRLARMAASAPWERGRLFDWTANVLAFIPLGFGMSGGACSRMGGSVARRRAALRSAAGCLGLACLAEGLQFWLPLRVPSWRDIMALELGAIVGCGFWLAAGPLTSRMISCPLRGLSQRGRARYCRFKWAALFAGVFCVVLAINALADPVDWFEIYRRRALISPAPAATGRIALGGLMAIGLFAASGITVLCRLGESALAMSANRGTLRIFDPRASAVDDETQTAGEPDQFAPGAVTGSAGGLSAEASDSRPWAA